MNSKDYGKQKMAAWLTQLPGILLLLLLAFAFLIHHSTLNLDFIELPLSLGYQYVLVFVHIFSR